LSIRGAAEGRRDLPVSRSRSPDDRPELKSKGKSRWEDDVVDAPQEHEDQIMEERTKKAASKTESELRENLLRAKVKRLSKSDAE